MANNWYDDINNARSSMNVTVSGDVPPEPTFTRKKITLNPMAVSIDSNGNTTAINNSNNSYNSGGSLRINTSELDNYNPNLGGAISGINAAGSVKVDTSLPQNVIDGQGRINNRISTIDALSGKKATKDDINYYQNLRPENQYEKDLVSGISRLADYSAGNSQVDRTIANRALNRFDASQGAASLAQAQRIASNPYLSQGAKQAAVAELNRTMGSQRSDLTGQLAQQAQERAFTATQQYTNAAQEASKYNEQKFQSDLSAVSNDLNRELSANIAAGNLETTALNNATEVWGKQVDSMIADANRGLQAAIAAGDLTATDAKLRLDTIGQKIKAQTDEITLNLQKNRDDVNARQVDATIAEISQRVTNNFAATSNASLIQYQLSNPNATVQDMMSDPVVMGNLRNEWSSIPGNTGEPSEAWVTARLAQAPTPGKYEQQVTTEKMGDTRQSFIDGGMDPALADQFVNTFKLAKDSGGYITKTSDDNYKWTDVDGSSYVMGIDPTTGKPTLITKSVAGEKIIPEGKTTGDVYSEEGVTYLVGTDNQVDEVPEALKNLGVGEYNFDSTTGKLWTKGADNKVSEVTLPEGNSVYGGAIYKNSSGEISKIDPEQYNTLTMDDIKKMDPKTDLYKNVMDSFENKTISVGGSKNLGINNTFQDADIGKTVKFTLPGEKPMMVKVIGKTSHTDTNGPNRTNYSWIIEDANGKQYETTTYHETDGRDHNVYRWREITNSNVEVEIPTMFGVIKKTVSGASGEWHQGNL